MSFTLEKIAEALGAKLTDAKPATEIVGLAPLHLAKSSDLTFLSDVKYLNHLNACQAGVVILKAEHALAFSGPKLIMDNPYLGFARAARLFDRAPTQQGVHSSAVVHDTAELGENVSLGAHVVIGAHVTIGANTVIMPGVVIADNTSIGECVTIYPSVSIYHNTIVGDRTVIQAGAVIGSDGFGLAKDEAGRWVKIPQLGQVIIGSDVEIGANTSIDRGALENTIIADFVKLDNQIQVAHNVTIGEGTAIAACTGIAGSTKIGRNCLFAGMVGIAGHLSITDNVMLTAKSGVTGDIKAPGVYSSTLRVLPVKQWLKNAARLTKLDALVQRVKQLEKEKAK